jgi:glutamyl-tRNA reductase
MSALLTVGLNHDSAPISLREKVAFDPQQLPNALRLIRSDVGIKEAAILSTCNRTELYLSANPDSLDQITHWLSDYHQLNHSQLAGHIYHHPDAEAVRHMMRVAAGLDSMMLGEPQILGQVKDAYHQASDAGTVGKTLSRLFQKTFSVAKSVRTETDIGKNAISVAYAAVSLTKQVFGQLNEYRALLIGAGETIELVARHLSNQKIGNITVANRTIDRAHSIAEPLGGSAISLSAIEHQLENADIIISSTAAPDTIISKEMVRSALTRRKHRPMLFIDLAVPRDIESEITDLSDTFLYAVDDLKAIIDENVKSRQSAAAIAETIIDGHVEDFIDWLKQQAHSNQIQELRQTADQITQQLITKAQQQVHNGEDAQQVIERLGHSLSQQLMHGPTRFIKEAIKDQDKDSITRLLNSYHKNSH